MSIDPAQMSLPSPSRMTTARGIRILHSDRDRLR